MNPMHDTQLPEPVIRKIVFDWKVTHFEVDDGHREFWFGVNHPAPTAEELGDICREFNVLFRTLVGRNATATIHWDDSFSVVIPIPRQTDRVQLDSVLNLIDLLTELKPDNMESEIWSVAHERLAAPTLTASQWQ